LSALCDTNIVSELVRVAPDPGVLKWASRVSSVALSAIVVEEIRYGLAWHPSSRIEAWFESFLSSRTTVIPVSGQIAAVAGRLRGELQAKGKSRSQADMLIGATALVEGLTLVTRNVGDFEGCGIALLNPFS